MRLGASLSPSTVDDTRDRAQDGLGRSGLLVVSRLAVVERSIWICICCCLWLCDHIDYFDISGQVPLTEYRVNFRQTTLQTCDSSMGITLGKMLD
jgi:hypothetical protein